jgi:hypothetical protein
MGKEGLQMATSDMIDFNLYIASHDKVTKRLGGMPFYYV